MKHKNNYKILFLLIKLTKQYLTNSDNVFNVRIKLLVLKKNIIFNNLIIYDNHMYSYSNIMKQINGSKIFILFN